MRVVADLRAEALRAEAEASSKAAAAARKETEKTRATSIKAVEQATVLANKNLSISDRKLTEAMAKTARAEFAAAESRESVLTMKAALATANQALAESKRSAAEHAAAEKSAHAASTAAAKKQFDAKTAALEQELAKARQTNESAKALAQSLRAAHAKQIAELSAKQSADLAKIREIARRTAEEFKKREADAEKRAAQLHEELCALKVALAEARDACAAAVGESNDAKRVLKVTVLLGAGACVLARNGIANAVKKVTEKKMNGK